MATKKKRIIIALDEKYISQLDQICKKMGVKQYSKAIIYLLNIISINL